MRNIKLTLAYDGTDFSGWQIQPGQPGDVVPSAAVRAAGAGIMMRDQGDKEIRFACGLAVLGCGRSGVAKSEMSDKEAFNQPPKRRCLE
jgi:hypothetical protein